MVTTLKLHQKDTKISALLTYGYAWWKIIFGGCGVVYRNFEKCRETQEIFTKFFHSLRRLNLKGTTISTGDFGRVTSVAKRLHSLNIENCINVDESSIFKAKDCFSRLKCINITNNMHYSLCAIACLCSYRSLEVCVNGILLDHTDMLFLAKTFPC